MKKTEWFPGDVMPVHVGAYERDYDTRGFPVYSFWNGRQWGPGAVNPLLAQNFASQQRLGVAAQNLSWRGIAK